MRGRCGAHACMWMHACVCAHLRRHDVIVAGKLMNEAAAQRGLIATTHAKALHHTPCPLCFHCRIELYCLDDAAEQHLHAHAHVHVYIYALRVCTHVVSMIPRGTARRLYAYIHDVYMHIYTTSICIYTRRLYTAGHGTASREFSPHPTPSMRAMQHVDAHTCMACMHAYRIEGRLVQTFGEPHS